MTVSFSGSTGRVEGISTSEVSNGSSKFSSALIAGRPPGWRVDRSFQTVAWAKPTRPDDGAASVASCAASDHDRDALALGRLGGDRQGHGEHPVLVPGGRGFCVDRLVERDAALEGAVLDLELAVTAGPLGATALAGDHEHAVGRDHLDLGRVDTRQLDDHAEPRGVLAADAVDLRA